MGCAETKPITKKHIIIKPKKNVQGITTAAGLFCSARDSKRKGLSTINEVSESREFSRKFC